MAVKTLERIEQFAIDVILMKRYGKRAALLRMLLYILSFGYNGIVRLRYWLYETRICQWHSVGCKVISVGNLTVGGTGKTPVVEKTARTLRDAGRKVAILSRGYKSIPRPLWQRLMRKLRFGAKPDPPRIVSDGKALLLDSERAGDEPCMLATNLDDVVVLVDKDRVKSALYAIENMGIDTIILDDGYQYLPLKERINICLVDRYTPFGNRFLLPRGTLREPKDHMKRSDVIFITKCDGSDISEIKNELRKYNCHAPIHECTHHPVYLQDLSSGDKLPLDYLTKRKVGALSGIAVPESFEAGLKNLGAQIIYRRHYADHHRFSEREVVNAINRTHARGGHALITTEKDAIRFPRIDRRPLPVYFLRVEINLLSTEEDFASLILRACGIEAEASFVTTSAAGT
ncbi:MAG: tetraacyldisaccharide 4'-kinase [Verrucomicrobiota bacterium]